MTSAVTKPNTDRTQHANTPRVGFLVVGRGRPGFDPEWGERMRAAAWQCARTSAFDFVQPSAPATDESSMRRALEELRQSECEGLVILQPTMGDGRLVPTLIQQWRDPVVLWATTERQDSDRVSACTLVGTHAFASLMRQRRSSFEIVNGHPEQPHTATQLDRALRLTLTAARLRRARIGLVGTHAPGFLNMEADPTLLANQFGATMHHFGVRELIDAAAAIDDHELAKDRAQVDAMAFAHDDEIPDSALDHNSRYLLAIQKMVADQRLDALAVRGWPELPNTVGAWPYVAFSRLGDMGYALAMEGDFDGAVTLLLGRLMGYGVGYLSDWLEHDEKRITLWHQGEAPLSICEPGATLGRHFNNDKPVVVNARLAADRPITLCRLWHCDGQYHLMAADARTEPPPRVLKGTCGSAVLEDGRDVPTWFDHLCHQGMPHHLGIFQGHRTTELKRLARQLGVRWDEA